MLGMNRGLGIDVAEISDEGVRSPVHVAFLYLLTFLGPDFVPFP